MAQGGDDVKLPNVTTEKILLLAIAAVTIYDGFTGVSNVGDFTAGLFAGVLGLTAVLTFFLL